MKQIPNPKKIKAIAIDLDGTTLLPDTTLGEKTIKVVRKLISDGMQVIISTGRAVEASEPFRSALGAEGPMVFFNGAEITDVPSGKILSVSPVDNDIMEYCIDIARELNIYFQIYIMKGILPEPSEHNDKKNWEPMVMEKPGEEAEFYHKHTGITPIRKDLKKLLTLQGMKCIKGMYIADTFLHDEIRKKLNVRFEGRVSITRSLTTFLEILNNGVSKGEGLKIAMKHRGLKPEEVIAFGDEENDLSMTEAAGFFAVPANARQAIKEKADFIYGSNAEEGLAVFLEEHFCAEF